LQGVTGPGVEELNSLSSVVQGVVLLFGAIFFVFLLVGPGLAWGLGFMLRNVTNQWLHVLAFAVLGLLVGALLGPVLGIGGLLAPAAGTGTGPARWFTSPFAATEGPRGSPPPPRPRRHDRRRPPPGAPAHGPWRSA